MGSCRILFRVMCTLHPVSPKVTIIETAVQYQNQEMDIYIDLKKICSLFFSSFINF